jgi:hypothetical protein
MVIVNFWLLLSPVAEVALKGVARVTAPGSGPVAMPVAVTSTQFPLVNFLSPATVKMIRNYPERNRAHLMPPGLWNCYARGEGLHSFVAMREDLQRIEEAYPEFQVAGCWNYVTGQPVGGVGSPWFGTPTDLADMMPDGVLQDITLGAGQAARIFV